FFSQGRICDERDITVPAIFFRTQMKKHSFSPAHIILCSKKSYWDYDLMQFFVLNGGDQRVCSWSDSCQFKLPGVVCGSDGDRLFIFFIEKNQAYASGEYFFFLRNGKQGLTFNAFYSVRHSTFAGV